MMDKDSRKVATYFRRLNICLLVVNIILTVLLAVGLSNMVATNDQLESTETEYNWVTGEYEREKPENNGEMDPGTLCITLLVGASWTILEYFVGMLIIKHFENVATTKELALKQSRDLDEIKSTIQQLNIREEYQHYVQNNSSN